MGGRQETVKGIESSHTKPLECGRGWKAMAWHRKKGAGKRKEDSHLARAGGGDNASRECKNARQGSEGGK